MNASERLIVALDYPEAASALKTVDLLGDAVAFYKVGLQLFIAEGPDLVRSLADRGKNIFLDLKLHDIPNTVAGAVRSIGRLGVQMLTVHAGGGEAMLSAAVQAAAESATPPMVLAVTVLTSIDSPTLTSVGVIGSASEQVVRLAHIAAAAHCPGIVCSPQELREVRREMGPSLKTVVPGIRPTGAATQDQSRIATPSDAILHGADHLVVGRPITAAADPLFAAREILFEIDRCTNASSSRAGI